jgi:leucyl aminopeptidase
MTVPTLRLTLTSASLSSVDADWLVVGIGEGVELPPPVAALNADLGGDLARLRQSGDLTGKHLELVPLLTPRNIKARRIFFVGLGRPERQNRGTGHDAMSSALRSITTKQCGRVAVALPPPSPTRTKDDVVLAAGVGAVQGSVGPGIRKTEPTRHPPAEIQLVADEGTNRASLESALQRATAEARAVTLARILVNQPPCELYPESFAQRCQQVARECGIGCEVWDADRLRAERMGAILGIAQGSDRPARFVILRYRHGGDRPALGLIGKGVTFDSGGLSIKDSDQMVDMKCDMAGAATVLAACQAIAELKLALNVMAFLPLVENLPSGRAVKLGDVLHARNGKTIEILNTDAEGRVILADALAYAAEQKLGHLVDLATLTGSCMVALGTETAGLMTNNESWGERVRSAIQRAGERAWPLPMDEEFEELLRSKVADLKNAPGTRYGGAIAGGKFLEQFVGSVPWVHLDIAGPAWAESECAARDSGGTGAFVRSLTELAHDYAATR